ncbi:peptide-methionine (S)-S-oxide reductase [Ferrimonas senticii]|uniref:peptide-methionine (S)-S-oxide reductase n=1 Tax=Ferrimonas senticii TaxID=394566 RepID=UPI0003FD914B|nr:peptide-methionine (S)-S-oxide reductase [Ferrimonas senticii]
MQQIYLAGGCLWGVQEFVRYLPGVINTEAGRANGSSNSTRGDYDGYAECVRVEFEPQQTSVAQLVAHLFEIIDPYSIDQQGPDLGHKYRTGVYSTDPRHLVEAKDFIAKRDDAERVVVEVLPLTNFVRSDEQHQDRLSRCPDDICHLPKSLLHRYKRA